MTAAGALARRPATRGPNLTVEAVERDVRNVVLPDDAELTGDEHSWTLLAERLGAQGVEVTIEQLRRPPYDVILNQRLRACLPHDRVRRLPIGARGLSPAANGRTARQFRNLSYGVNIVGSSVATWGFL